MVKIIRNEEIPEKISLNELYSNYVNNIIHGDTLNFLKKLPDKSVHLIVTSPSYFLGKEYEKDKDYRNLEQYKNYLKEHTEIIKECKRVLRNNGSIFWNVAQTPINGELIPLGAEYYNIFKDFNFYLKNWIIWKFKGGETPRNRLFGRYENVLWVVKDPKKHIFNIDSVRIPSKYTGLDKRCNTKGKNPEDYWVFDNRTLKNKLNDIQSKIKQLKLMMGVADRFAQFDAHDLLDEIEHEFENMAETKNQILNKNIYNQTWHINRVSNNNKKEKIKHPLNGHPHPCQFPEELIKRIVNLSTYHTNKHIVLDIFNGSGTTCKVANDLGRSWIGIDKELKYCEIAKHRIESASK